MEQRGEPRLTIHADIYVRKIHLTYIHILNIIMDSGKGLATTDVQKESCDEVATRS